LYTGEKSLFRHRVAMANAAGLDFYSHLSGARLRYVALDYFEWPARAGYLGNVHFWHGQSTPQL